MPYLVQNSIFFFKQEHTSMVAYKNACCMHESAVTAHIMHRVFLYTAKHQIELCH